MWPGQQPPGGEQNPQNQNPNPYQQPGYQQPNPYQQPGQQSGQPAGPPPGYPQPNPYQQPTVPQYAVPGPAMPGPAAPQPPDEKKKTTVIAVVAALAVLATAGVTGFVVLGDDKNDDKKTTAADKKPSASASQQPGGGGSAPPVDNPRDGSGNAKPTVDGWKVVTNPKYGTQFDVPPDWTFKGSGWLTGFEDEKKGDGSPVVSMTAPAHLKPKWCQVDDDRDGKLDDYSLAGVGTKGGQGAKNTAEGATNEAETWTYAAFAQNVPKAKLRATIKTVKAKPYTTKSGLAGHLASASASNLQHKTKCDTDGKAYAFTFKNKKGDFSTWVLYANTNVKDEYSEEKVLEILNTLRLTGDMPTG